MTADRNAEIQARVDALPDLPWERVGMCDEWGDKTRPVVDALTRIIPGSKQWCDEDAELIAHAPADLQHLLDENKELKAALEKALTALSLIEYGLVNVPRQEMGSGTLTDREVGRALGNAVEGQGHVYVRQGIRHGGWDLL